MKIRLALFFLHSKPLEEFVVKEAQVVSLGNRVSGLVLSLSDKPSCSKVHVSQQLTKSNLPISTDLIISPGAGLFFRFSAVWKPPEMKVEEGGDLSTLSLAKTE